MTEEKKKDAHLEKLYAHQAEQMNKLRINEHDLNPDFIEQAPNYVDACSKYHKAQLILQDQKLILERVCSEKDLEIRNSGVKTTEAFITKSLDGDAQVQNQKRVVNRASHQVNIYQAIVKGWEQKKDMLIQVGSNQRAEYSGQVAINRGQANNGTTRPRTLNGRETEL